MDFLPIFVNIRDQPCLVIGGGEIAARKTGMLLRAKAQVTVVSPELGTELTQHLIHSRITHRIKRFEPDDLKGFRLVISATNDRDVNIAVAAAANRIHLPVNVVDDPELCSFIFPAIVDRHPVLIAVSTGGASPVLARLIRAQLEQWIPATYGQLASLAETARHRVKTLLPDGRQRRLFWEQALKGRIAQLTFAGQHQEAEQSLYRLLEQEASDTKQKEGFVSLVGAGPGDPDLLTLKALRILQEADVIVFDRLVSPDILRLARTDAERIDAGKARSQHTLPQEEINALLVSLALEGKHVVRLKGGDPFVFGRGGEEIETLKSAGIPFQVVPGITAATGCAAYGGIPLTHRDYAQSVTFITGHTKEGDIQGIDWPSVARPNHTLVIYMGLQALPIISRELIKVGCSPGLPAAIIEQGTTADQRVITGTLASLFADATQAEIQTPALIIVGDVVKLRRDLAWFENSKD
jgi:uroporphyrin-III C-methyltransferase/precorrin-2 dehydrogenase/sirohydrochlorin ferrochelatase